MTDQSLPEMRGESPGRFLKIRDVVDQVGLHRRTIYRLIREGRFPKSIRLGPQRVAWKERDIEAWKASQLEHQT